MAKVYGPDNSNYKDFVPTYEYPILRRQIRRVRKHPTRVRHWAGFFKQILTHCVVVGSVSGEVGATARVCVK